VIEPEQSGEGAGQRLASGGRPASEAALEPLGAGRSGQTVKDRGIPANPPGSAPVNPRGALGRLILVVGAGIVAAVLTHAVATLVVVLAIVVIIMLHEGGHFVMAKWAGMKVTEYFVGFGPRVWSFRRGETEYGVKAIPAGGYVKIIGMTNLEEVDPANEPRTYRQGTFWRRLSVVVAGSVVHFILALVLLWSVFALAGIPNPSKVSVGSLSHLQGAPSPARAAGLRPGDVFVSVNGHRVGGPESLVKLIKSHAGDHLDVVVDRHGQPVHLSVIPVDGRSVKVGGQAVATGSAPVGLLGVDLTAPTETVGPIASVGRAASGFGGTVIATFQGLGTVFSTHGLSSLGHQVVSAASGTNPSGSANSIQAQQNRPVSIVGITRVASQAAHAGIGDFLGILVVFNVFIGIFNLVPLMPLDGGHVAITIYERIRSRAGRPYRADAAKLAIPTYFVLAAIVLLGVSTLYLDLVRPIPNPFQ